MSYRIPEESSSCDTASNSEPLPSRQIILDVFYSSIYRPKKDLNDKTQLPKKQLFIFKDCYVVAHRQSSKIKTVHRERELIKLLKDGFEIIAEVRFERTRHGDYVFTVQRNLNPEKCHQSLRDVLTETRRLNINSKVFVYVKSEQEYSDLQLIKDQGFIKMGKEIYETRIVPYNRLNKSIKLIESDPKSKMCFNSKESSLQCKICLSNEGSSDKDYIVSPCKCSGSCSGVHIECLRNWIYQKIEVGRGDLKLKTYDMAKFACEICKEKYPEHIQVENSFVEMTPKFKILSDTLIMTKIHPAEDEKKYTHFISLEKGKTLNIGRQYCNDLVIEDVSVSRTQAFIYRSTVDEKLYIADKDSKFGTFCSLETPIRNLKDIMLHDSRRLFMFRMVDDNKDSSSSSRDNEMTEEGIEY